MRRARSPVGLDADFRPVLVVLGLEIGPQMVSLADHLAQTTLGLFLFGFLLVAFFLFVVALLVLFIDLLFGGGGGFLFLLLFFALFFFPSAVYFLLLLFLLFLYALSPSGMQRVDLNMGEVLII
jgi:hypothetical protein